MESNELELLANHSIVFKSADKLAEILLNKDVKKSIYFFIYSFQQLQHADLLVKIQFMPFFINTTVFLFSKLRNNSRKDEFRATFHIYGYAIIEQIKNCIEEYHSLLQQFLDYVKYVKQNNILAKNE
jgi:hypothetical protein